MRAVVLLLLGVSMVGAFGQPVVTERNVQTFGASVRTVATVKGDFSAVGARVVVDQAVAEDALLVGGTVDVRAPVGGDVRAVGGDISLENTVGGDLMAAGGNLQLTQGAQVAGRAELAGGEVRVEGRVEGPLNVRARRLVLNGPVGGGVQAAVQELELGPQARLSAGLRHSASTITQDPAAVVTGAVDRIDRLFGEDRRWDDMHPMHDGRWPVMGGWWLLVPLSMGLLGVLALAGLVLFVFSRFAGRAAHQIESQPWRAVGVGAGLLLALPVLAVLLFFTLLGIPLGMVVMVLYPPLLLLGWLIGALFVARWLVSRASPADGADPGVPYGWMAAAVIALLVVAAVPVVGPLLMSVTVAAGLGACVLEWRHRLASRSDRAP